MTMKRKILAFVAILAVAFAAGQNLVAQTTAQTVDPTKTQDLEDEITQMNQAGQEDLTALLTRMSTQYNVELSVLLDLSAQGYSPGQLWLALEITATSDTTLANALVLVGETEGQGWGVLAQALGVKPGSAEFFALKEKFGQHKGNVIWAMDLEHEKKGQENGKPENGKGGNGAGKGNRG